MPKVTKETLLYLAGLGKLKIKKEDEEKLIRDLEKILAHFEELKEVDTEKVEPLAGGTPQESKLPTGQAITENVFREDDNVPCFKLHASGLTEAFPEKENRFLRIPPVFGE